jgi:glycosyltransferase involved in cell wall biosynthesis
LSFFSAFSDKCIIDTEAIGEIEGELHITVTICTWNRCELLKRTLEQMTKLLIPPGITWELLIVNNNCSDATDMVIASFSDRLPVRRLFQPRPGRANALNLAVQEASGDYILWTDDDVLVDEIWVAEYCDAFSRWPEAAIFGGTIQPWFAQTPPQWLRRVWQQVANAYGILDHGNEPLPLTQKRVPYGANMVVRTKDQSRYFYDPRLGVSPKSRIGGEETTMVRAMLSAGATGWWVPRARVRHYIGEGHQTTRYLRRYFFGYGEYLGRQMSDHGRQKLFGRPRWVWRQAIEAEVMYRFAHLVTKPEVWIEYLKTSSTAWGQLRGYASRHTA